MAVIDIPDRMTLTAPAPDAVATATVQTVGRPGLGNHFYWLVSHFPIGIVVSEPFPVWNAPQPMDTNNYVLIVWTPTPGAVSYDLLRTETPLYPSLPGNFALAIGLTATQYQDQGQALSSYNLSGLPHGAPVSALVHLNNRDYSSPVMEMPSFAMKVSTLIFSDGSMQWTAGGGGASAPILVAGAGINLVTSIGPPPTVTISSTGMPSGASGQIQYNNAGSFGASPNLVWNNANSRLGIRVPNPQTGLEVNDTVYVTGSTSSPTSGAGVEVWYDAAVGTPAGQGGIDAYDFSSAAYKRFFLDGNPLLLNSDLNNTGHVGINNTAPAYKLDVTGDINCSGTYRVNGAPLSMGGAQVGATPPASPSEGDFWYDSTNFRLFIRHSNAWFQVSA